MEFLSAFPFATSRQCDPEVPSERAFPTVVHRQNPPFELLLVYRTLLLQAPAWVSGKNEDREGE